MVDRELCFETGDATVDARLRDIVEQFEATWPGYIRSYYLFGSYAEGSAIPSSDVDMIIVWRGTVLTATENALLKEFAANWSRQQELTLDILVLTAELLQREGHFRVKHGSVLLYGDDLRATIPSPTLDTYLDTYAQAPFSYAAAVFRHSDHLVLPLAYPNRDALYYGYVLNNHEPLKAFVAAACWNASLLVSPETGEFIALKSKSIQRYRAVIGGSWAEYAATIYEYGKYRWHYAMPLTRGEQEILSDLCRAYLAFENHYFTRYRHYLLAEFARGDRKRTLVATQQLAAITYPDIEVTDALIKLSEDSDDAIASTARRALASAAIRGG